MDNPSVEMFMDTSVADAVTSERATMVPVGIQSNPLTQPERLVLSVILAVVALCGIFGNCLVIVAVWLSRKLRNATNVYVVNLSIADVVTCLSVPVYIIALLSVTEWPGNEISCSIVAALSMVCVGCSQFTLACIALNRLILVTKSRSMYNSLYCRRNLIISTILTWFIPIAAVILPPVFGIGDLGFDPKYTRCGPTHDESHTYDFIMATVMYPFPFGIIIFCYVKIFIFVKRHCHNMAPSAPSVREQEHSSTTTSQRNNEFVAQLGQRSESNAAYKDAQIKQTRKRFSQRQHQITKNLFYVVCAFVLCLTPYTVLLLIPGSDRFVPYAGVLFLCNSALNPAIYASKHPHFKAIFKAIVQMEFSDIPEPVSFIKNAHAPKIRNPPVSKSDV